ncbi:MAG: putative zinc-binding protein [Planctomycetota bacterium]
MAKPSCSCQGGVKMVLACAGASNVGQMTNEVAKRLDEAGAARYFCLAGVGGHISGMVESVKGADKVLVLDGCEVACAKKTLDAAEIKGYQYLVLTDMGVKKVHEFKMPEDQLKAVEKRAAEALK